MSAFEKIRSLEIAPPEGVWSSIAAALELNETEQALSQKINQFTSTPPPALWSDIKRNLNETKRNRLYHTTPPRQLRYAVVIAFILLSTAGYFLFFQSNNAESQQAHQVVNTVLSKDRYHKIINPRGEIIHVSDKIFQLDCIRENKVSDTIDVLKRLQNGGCFSNITIVQTELAYATMLNSPGGIVELMQIIQSEK